MRLEHLDLSDSDAHFGGNFDFASISVSNGAASESLRPFDDPSIRGSGGSKRESNRHSNNDDETRSGLMSGVIGGAPTIDIESGDGGMGASQTTYFWNLASYRPYFNVTTVGVTNRLKMSIQPWKSNTGGNSFFDSLDPSTGHIYPDLYGPLWITITLLFMLSMSSNLNSRITHNYIQQPSFHSITDNRILFEEKYLNSQSQSAIHYFPHGNHQNNRMKQLSNSSIIYSDPSKLLSSSQKTRFIENKENATARYLSRKQEEKLVNINSVPTSTNDSKNQTVAQDEMNQKADLLSNKKENKKLDTDVDIIEPKKINMEQDNKQGRFINSPTPKIIRMPWKARFEIVTVGSTLMAASLFLPASLMWTGLLYHGSKKRFVELLSLTGYALPPFMVVGLLCIIPSSFLQWCLLLIGAVGASRFVVKNLKSEMVQLNSSSVTYQEGKKFLTIGVVFVFVLYVAVAALIKFVFFT